MKELLHHAERLLQAHALEDSDPALLAGLLARAKERQFATGEVLSHEGDSGDDLFFLIEGRIQVSKRDHAGEERRIGLWFAPAILGAMGALGVAGGPATRVATCVAAAPCKLLALDGAAARALVADAGPEGTALRWLLLASFTEMLANTTDRLREALAKPAAASLGTIQAALYGTRNE
jgi:CRP-like cAMP-binding protein